MLIPQLVAIGVCYKVFLNPTIFLEPRRTRYQIGVGLHCTDYRWIYIPSLRDCDQTPRQSWLRLVKLRWQFPDPHIVLWGGLYFGHLLLSLLYSRQFFLQAMSYIYESLHKGVWFPVHSNHTFTPDPPNELPWMNHRLGMHCAPLLVVMGPNPGRHKVVGRAKKVALKSSLGASKANLPPATALAPASIHPVAKSFAVHGCILRNSCLRRLSFTSANPDWSIDLCGGVCPGTALHGKSPKIH